jgi:hypothetical protein
VPQPTAPPAACPALTLQLRPSHVMFLIEAD